MNLTPKQITVLPGIERPGAKVEDEALFNSMRDTGIQIPLVVVKDDERYLLAEGLRRLRLAKPLGIDKLPVVVAKVPEGVSPEDHCRRLRFILDHHRQDLLPTQKADMIVTLKEKFGLTHPQISRYMGIDSDSITNYLAVLAYIPPVQKAIDEGRVTMRAARAFRGMTEKGQETIWAKEQPRLLKATDSTHKEIRAEYDPIKHPSFYKNAPDAVARLTRKQAPRKLVKRPSFTPEDKRRLLNSFEMKEQELENLKAEQKQMKAEITAAIPLVAAIKRNEKLWAMVPVEMREELDRFSDVYI